MRLALHRPCAWTLALTLALAHVAVAHIGAGAADRSSTPTDELRRLRSTTEKLELQVALAESGSSYLVIDLPGGGMEMRLEGALLRRYPILEARLATPRIAFVRRAANAGPPLRRLKALSLQPARPDRRLELRANDGGPPPPLPEVPPTPDEAVPAPPRYELRSADGFVLEIVADDVAARPTIVDRLADAAAVLGLRDAGAVRLRLALPADEAAALYRAAPPGVEALLILASPASTD